MSRRHIGHLPLKNLEVYEECTILPYSEELQYFHRRSEEHTSELQSPCNLVCRLLLEKKTQLETFGDKPFLIIQITLSFQRGNVSKRYSITEQTGFERVVMQVHEFVARQIFLSAEIN